MRTKTTGKSQADSKSQSPVIVTGMHRSGTTMVANLLRKLGVHMGDDCSFNEESDFFRKLNTDLITTSGAVWYHPDPMRSALADADRRNQMAGILRSAIGNRLNRYWGVQSIDDMSDQWGWKDPRCMLTLPLWHLVWPQIRVIHIVRNGVDVAHSLMERERRVMGLSYSGIFSSVRLVWPTRRPEFKRRPFGDLQEAFELWAQYLSFGLEAAAPIAPQDLYRVRYEDFLGDPLEGLKGLSAFLKLKITAKTLEDLSVSVDRERRFAFVADKVLTDFYNTCRRHPMMRQLGYGQWES